MTPVNERSRYTAWQTITLVTLRILIGWHFLYEGAVKLYDPEWSSLGYLLDSHGLFSGLFYSLTSNQTVLQIVDLINIWGLILVGLGLILGLFARLSIISGLVLLSLYYLSHPPLPAYEYFFPNEGHYLIVDKNLIEIFAMVVMLVFPTSHIIGIDRLIDKIKN
ncbi:MAG: DoxX subfamily [Bacteroidetes bacterium RBG_13_42_15]|nr:MAG: DoxX subfamily [Bacteroidetes bacterium RBG_13_42_15]